VKSLQAPLETLQASPRSTLPVPLKGQCGLTSKKKKIKKNKMSDADLDEKLERVVKEIKATIEMLSELEWCSQYAATFDHWKTPLLIETSGKHDVKITNLFGSFGWDIDEKMSGPITGPHRTVNLLVFEAPRLRRAEQFQKFVEDFTSVGLDPKDFAHLL
jgi:hypothetical protein